MTKPCELCGTVTTVLVRGWDGTWPCPCGKWPGHAVCHGCLKEWAMGPENGRLAVCVEEVRLAQELMGQERPAPTGFPELNPVLEKLPNTAAGRKAASDLVEWRKQVSNPSGTPNLRAPRAKFKARVTVSKGLEADVAKVMADPNFEKNLMDSITRDVARDYEATMLGGEELANAVRESEEKRRYRERLLEP